ncbi:unnamed protein product [Auanema sp. JU1783]|nr:unnamed protein product [Auanema sp. JU1783]
MSTSRSVSKSISSLQDVSAHHATEIVHLNVGGKRYATLYETLARSKSVFFNQFIRIDEASGKVLLYHRYFTDDGQNAIFVNRDGELFAHVLHFLRDGKKAPLPSDQFLLKQLTRESEFYGLENWRRCLHEQLRYENTIKGDLEDAIVGIRADVSEIAKNSYQNDRTYQR